MWFQFYESDKLWFLLFNCVLRDTSLVIELIIQQLVIGIVIDYGWWFSQIKDLRMTYLWSDNCETKVVSLNGFGLTYLEVIWRWVWKLFEEVQESRLHLSKVFILLEYIRSKDRLKLGRTIVQLYYNIQSRPMFMVAK